MPSPDIGWLALVFAVSMMASIVGFMGTTWALHALDGRPKSTRKNA